MAPGKDRLKVCITTTHQLWILNMGTDDMHLKGAELMGFNVGSFKDSALGRAIWSVFSFELETM